MRKNVQAVSLFIVDELHLLGGRNGPVLEVRPPAAAPCMLHSFSAASCGCAEVLSLLVSSARDGSSWPEAAVWQTCIETSGGDKNWPAQVYQLRHGGHMQRELNAAITIPHGRRPHSSPLNPSKSGMLALHHGLQRSSTDTAFPRSPSLCAQCMACINERGPSLSTARTFRALPAAPRPHTQYRYPSVLVAENTRMVQVITSRMRYIASQVDKPMRIVGLSTSLADAKDLGEWIGATSHALFNFPPGTVLA